jgi:hypothetical protein
VDARIDPVDASLDAMALDAITPPPDSGDLDGGLDAFVSSDGFAPLDAAPTPDDASVAPPCWRPWTGASTPTMGT